MHLKNYFLLFNLLLTLPSFSQQWNWIRTISGTANDSGHSIDVDDSGFVFVTGRCKQLTTFENNQSPFGPITIGDRDVFVCKYSPNGDLLWARLAGTEKAPHYDLGHSIISDNNGGCYVSGIFNDTSFFGLDTIISAGQRDAFLTRLDENGNFLWTRRIGGSEHDYARNVSIDKNGDVLICGNIIGLVSINGNIVGTPNQTSGFIVKYDTDGNLLDYAHFDGPYKSSFEQLRFDNDNNIYTVGTLNGYGSVNGTTITTNNSASWQDICILKLDPNFNVIWSETAGGSYYDIANCMTLKDSCIYIGGSYSGTAVFDTITSTFNSSATGSSSNTHRDLFIAAYSLSGHIKWLKTAGNEGIDEIYGIEISDNNNLYVSGFFEDSLTYNDTTIYTQPSVTNGIVLRLDTLGDLLWSKTLTHNLNTRCYRIILDQTENIFVSGDYYGTMNFDTISYSAQNRDAFGGKLLQPTFPSFQVDSVSSYCFGDTISIELSALTSPLTYNYVSNDPHTFWLDSNILYYVVEQEPVFNISGKIITTNLFYSDTISINTSINVNNNPTPSLINDTTVCDTVSSLLLYSDSIYSNYSWSNNPLNNSYTNLVTNSGLITLNVTDSNNCSGTNQVNVLFTPCLSIEEITTTPCYINYNQKFNTITNSCKSEITHLQLLNTQGQIVFEFRNFKMNDKISLPYFPSGIYILKSTYSNLQIQSQKIIVINQ